MKVVLVALEFHLVKTRSSLFFIDILKSHFEDFQVVSDQDAWFELPRIKPELLIVYQRIFTPAELECFGARNIVLVPMYDACPHDEEFWNQYRPYKIFCFCKALHDFLAERNFQTYYAQYYCKPSSARLERGGKPRVFYWERSRLISWKTIKSLLADLSIESLHYHTARDITEANTDRPSDEETKRYGIVFSDWFETREDYLRILDGCSVYIAPRESEGIGLSFIEAISRGLSIIAPDAPTMNEYIRNGENGVLYDPRDPRPIGMPDIERMGRRALEVAGEGYARWLEAIPAMIAFIKKPSATQEPRRHALLMLKMRVRAIIRHYYKQARGAKRTRG